MKTILYITLAIIVYRLFYGFIFSQIAKILGAIFNPINGVIVAYNHREDEGFVKEFNKLQMNDALNTDIFLHRNLRALWNATLRSRKNPGTPFGEEGKSLSYAIGQKSIEKSISWIGWVLYIFLYIIDYKNWFKGGHCVIAYNNNK